MTQPRTYPPGVPSWVDTEQPDPEAACAFYGELLGWSFTEAMPPGAPGSYLIATLGGEDVAAIAPAPGGPAAWNLYVAVDDVVAAAERVRAAGGRIVIEPYEVGPGGSMAACEDPAGAAFRLWQAGQRLGAQSVNVPGAWNFSDLQTRDPGAAPAFYAAVFGWEVQPMAPGGPAVLRMPGYGDHLAATVDPAIHERQRDVKAPPGFADAIGWVRALGDAAAPRWQQTFGVSDRDDAAARARQLGGTVLATEETPWNRTVTIRDPQGAELTLSQFTPPSPADG